MITLSDLLAPLSPDWLAEPLSLTDEVLARPIELLSTDTRKLVGDDSLFVCIKGAVFDGHAYARRAYDAGCRVFVAEAVLDLPPDAIVIRVTDSRVALARMSAAFYRYPARELTVIGITGTKGKTTTALLIRHILEQNGISAGYIGSNGVQFAGKFYPTANTTPESCDLHAYLRQMADAGVKYVALEVSSQALYLNRVHGLDFPISIFTNLSPDHIGGVEHPTFEHYCACKRALFADHSTGCVIANLDDPATPGMIAGCDRIVGVSVEGEADLAARDIALFRWGSRLGVEFVCRHCGKEAAFALPLPGEYNVHNALCAAAVGLEAGLTLPQIAAAMATVAIKGRCEAVEVLSDVTFLIDYAHNGVSLRAALETLRCYDPARLICLFGSVGGRTQLRRPELGAVANELCDLAILTSDNPDFEDPEAVIADIAAAFTPDGCPYLIQPDRAEAIRLAVSQASPGDIVLLAGKGHEDYQLIRGEKVPFDERAVLHECAARLRTRL
ncbi:MAG: UDP-N-acetylmuramoyl-L-alanyl-D-glutamate--2,6-diaminopimelate ligase [Clostridia bacterium]|nr:UDP-N-acetylmuramoyl-L-alanyl-D-glutamate--2,6-diaminopimelate ligase [Clostridia bacterium]